MASTKQFCAHCGDDASERCGQCKDVHYCSAECQLADWRFHKLLCKQVEAFKVKPSPNVCRAILFPGQKGSKPEFVWLAVGEGEETPLSVSVLPDLKKFMGENGAMAIAPLVCAGKSSGKNLDHGICGMSRADLALTGHPPNPCVARLVGRDVAAHWKGPAIIVATTEGVSSGSTIDIQAADFTLALDGLVDLHSEAVTGAAPEKPRSERKFTGVHVTVAEDGTPEELREVKVPRGHPAFEKGTLSEVVDFLCHPVRMLKCSASTATTSTASIDQENLAVNVNCLSTPLDPTSEEFGKVPARLLGDASNVLIVSPVLPVYGLFMLKFTCSVITDKILPTILRFPEQGRAESLKEYKMYSKERMQAIGKLDAAGRKEVMDNNSLPDSVVDKATREEFARLEVELAGGQK